jgi:MurNAc alpha-1-phosphate uridylyltransferase
MVLAAGLGQRMRPITERIPKPLVQVGGKTLLDHCLDKLAAARVTRAVVNVHYLADQIVAHVATRRAPQVTISDERDQLLDTGGGVVKAMPLLGDAPFFHVNADTLWLDGVRPNLAQLAALFDHERMDALLLLASATHSIGYDGRGDFLMAPNGQLKRRPEREVAPFVYAGAAILSPRLFQNAPQGPFSLVKLFRQAEDAGRLYGMRLDGLWMHVGTPEAIGQADAALLDSVTQ